MLTQKPYKQFGCQAGFSLIELMIALVISLFLIGGILSIFSSNQQTSQVKRELDNAQEAFRFASFSITRIVKLGGGASPSDPAILEPSNDNELLVSFLHSPGITDCLGLPAPAGGSGVAMNTFYIEDNALLCKNDSAQIATLVSNVDSMEVRYGVPGNSPWIEDANFMLAAELEENTSMDWADVTSVHIQLRMIGSGLETTFVAAARGKLIAQHGGGVAVDNEDVLDDQDENNGGLDGNDEPNPNDNEHDAGNQPPIDTGGDDNSDPSGGENDDGGSISPPTGVSCSCKQTGGSGKFSLTGSNPASCSDQCCNDAGNKCSGNKCDFIAWCPTP